MCGVMQNGESMFHQNILGKLQTFGWFYSSLFKDKINSGKEKGSWQSAHFSIKTTGFKFFVTPKTWLYKILPWYCSAVVEHLPSMLKATALIPSTAKCTRACECVCDLNFYNISKQNTGAEDFSL